jgi:hypothetical protein
MTTSKKKTSRVRIGAAAATYPARLSDRLNPPDSNDMVENERNMTIVPTVSRTAHRGARTASQLSVPAKL